MNRDYKLELIYENMFISDFLTEGKKETIQILKNKGIEDVIINKIIDTDTTPSKADSIRLGNYFLEPNSDLENILLYYKKFSKLKAQGKAKDINEFKIFKDLEGFVDRTEKTYGDIDIEAKVVGEDIKKERIYVDENVDIYHADNVKKACRYGHDLVQSYSFCISSRGSGNAFGGYRLTRESNFYFCLFKKRDSSIKNGQFVDPSHMCVIDIQPDESLQWTWADNGKQNHGTMDTTWDEVLQEYPELNNPKNKGIFKERRLSPEEKQKIQRYQRIRDYEEYDKFNELSYDEKKEYITSTFQLDFETFNTLDKDLRNEYLGIGHPINDEWYNSLSEPEKNRWETVRLTVLQGLAQAE